MINKEKRNFRRYKRNSTFNLNLNGSQFGAELLDYSLDGLCLKLNGNPSIEKDEVVGLSIAELNMDTVGKIVWSKTLAAGLKVGVHTAGPIKGSLDEYCLSDVLIGLQRSAKTGVLEIKSGHIQKKIYIQKGNLIFSASNQDADRLGDILLEEGKINKKQFDESAELLKKTGKRQGTILVELGYLRPDELIFAVKHQVEQIILSLFRLKNSEFEFKEGLLPSHEIITLHISAANIIHRGIKAITNEARLMHGFPALDSILCFSPHPIDLFQDITLEEIDKIVLSRIDGKKTIRDIISALPFDEFDTIRTIHALLCTWILDIKEENGDDAGITPEEVIGEPVNEVPEVALKKIEEMHQKFKGLDFYSLLGIRTNASAEEIKKAYFKSAREFHPDRQFYLSPATKEKLHEIFLHITNAYSTLTNPLRKKEYDKILTEKK